MRPARLADADVARLTAETNQALGLLDSELFELGVDMRPGAPIQAVVPVDGAWETLDLHPHSVRSDDYQILVQIEDGSLVPHMPGPVRTMRGVVLGDAGSQIAGNVNDEGLSAMITLGDGRRFWVEPIAGRIAGAPFAAHVVYADADVIPSDGMCGNAGQRNEAEIAARAAAPQVEVDGTALGAIECAELACDADFEYFQDWGSVAGVENRINSVTNMVNIQYENQTNITHGLTTIIVRTSSNDPYTSNSSGTLLCQFITEWTDNQQSIPFDVAKLFTGREITGGTIGQAANFGEICDRQGCCGCGSFGLDDGAFCHSQNDCCGSIACASDLMAHELGHLWDAVHCDPCDTTMRSFIGCFNTFIQGTINDIVAHRNSRTCLDTGSCGGGIGACCLPNGNCLPDVTATACATQGGAYQGDGISCAQANCDGGEPEGACCVGSTCIANQTSAECSAQGGVYQGNGTTCGGVNCGGGGSNDFCANATLIPCNSVQQFDNAGATPAQNDGGPGDPELPNGSPSCQWNGTPNDTHNTVWFSFVALDTSVAIETCDTPTIDTIIALYAGNCGNLQELACGEDDCGSPSGYESRICYDGLIPGNTYRIMVGNPGSWTGSDPGDITLQLICPCPEIGPTTGACCFGDRSCQVLTALECSNAGGQFEGQGTDCSPNPCVTPTGACCLPDGSCDVRTQAACDAAGGDYQGNGSSCFPGLCPEPQGACCQIDGTCFVGTPQTCAIAGGGYQGDGSGCAPNPCPQPGACCLADGDCVVVLQSLCTASGGDYQGAGTSCTPDPCPDPQGACCRVDGSCFVDTPAACSISGGAYQGDGTDCSPNECRQPGACCLPDGCAEVIASLCAASGGDFQGPGTTCTLDPCVLGACCFVAARCVQRTELDCINDGGAFIGFGTVCKPEPCEDGACCLPDGSCVERTEATCFAAGGAHQGAGTSCAAADCDGGTCPGDIDGNGAIEFNDLLALLSSWGPCAGCPADLDDSGAVDFNDLLVVLSSWGPCP